ncbi:MAG: SDR family oxidoreductase [Gammaproteobacteria bacterium]|nr:SDR family oxidoreductase [Gammaproteobacteria bacterium]
MFNLSLKHILITGAGSGIGLALATHFKQIGCTVSAVDLKVTDELLALNVNCFSADVSDQDSLFAAFKSACHKNGKLDGLINNAGIAIVEGPIGDADITVFERVLDINTKGVYLGIKYASQFLKSGGAIVNTASLAATVTMPEYCAYSMSKAAVVQVTKNAALQLGQHNIRVNSVSPGTITTPMEHADSEESRVATIATALSRPGDVSDLVGVYHFLLSDAAKYVTGIDVKVDGGWSAGITYAGIDKLISE